jgi:hypothetical protein
LRELTTWHYAQIKDQRRKREEALMMAEEGDWAAKRELEVLRREIAGVGSGGGRGGEGESSAVGETEGR